MDVTLTLDEVRDLATRTLMALGASQDNADAEPWKKYLKITIRGKAY